MLTLQWTGYQDAKGIFWLLSWWPSEAGEQAGGGFDVDAWDKSKTNVAAAPADRAAFREAYRLARIEARKHGGLEFVSVGSDEEPCPLPDLPLKSYGGALMVDNSPSYRSVVSHADSDWAKGYTQSGEFRGIA